jgi:hypothetical protein
VGKRVEISYFFVRFVRGVRSEIENRCAAYPNNKFMTPCSRQLDLLSRMSRVTEINWKSSRSRFIDAPSYGTCSFTFVSKTLLPA